jgi:hypothetical protein
VPVRCDIEEERWAPVPGRDMDEDRDPLLIEPREEKLPELAGPERL